MPLIIERDLMKKPYLGGWKHKVTGIVYLNGDSQTGPRPKRVPPEKTCSRKVQTLKQADKECQPPYESAQQMWRKDCYIASVSDKYITAKPYKSSEEMLTHSDFDREVRIIQRCYRAYRILKFMKECARVYRKMLEECEKSEEERKLAKRRLKERECQALREPHTVSEEDALLNKVEREVISRERGVRSRLGLLSARQRALLSAEPRLRVARDARRRSSRLRFLRVSCSPRRWIDDRGRLVEMLGLRQQAARECLALYDELARDPDIQDATSSNCRLEVLIKARNSVENHFCKDADFFRYLLDQEISFVSQNIENSQLGYLRQRITGGYLQFLRTSHNCTCKSENGNGSPNICDYEFREPLDKNKVFCPSCRKLLSRNKFPTAVTKQQLDKCKGCLRLQANARGHVDVRPYGHMLRELRALEADLGAPDGLADVLRPADIRHLVLDVWHGHSALSGRSEPWKLRLARYDLEKPWSPWNCILLAEDELQPHLELGKQRMESPTTQPYSAHLRRRIGAAQRTARTWFRYVCVRGKCRKLLFESEESSVGLQIAANSAGI
ncbi:hypothetical protein QAD02_014460 [Eretmocerus hayati]|uniref:Uncharacterized protein n=1 Tax=Eretmocerus hayati TaxID=131215 RepID=A0ACC2P6E2_9HYME|nr:hypothetical protein QAD02_014460 [Eretmocerus hayati]